MSNFIRILKIIGRALRRFFCAIGRFFKFTAKKIAKGFKVRKQKRIIKKNEKTIGELFSEIGQNYYDAHKDDAEELLSELVGNVTGSKTAIDDARGAIDDLEDAYIEAKTAAKEKAKARRQSDKAAAKADKARINGEIIEEEPILNETAAEPASLVFDPIPEPAPVKEETPLVMEEPAPAPAPVVEEPALEPEPVVVEEPAPEPEPVVTEEPVPEPEPVAADEAAPEAEPVAAEEPEPEPVAEQPAAPAEEEAAPVV